MAFFQSDYDSNLTEFYHNVLNIKEPIFEYDFPESYHPPEKYFPYKPAFNLYLDRYRDQKLVKQMLKSKISKHIFNDFFADFQINKEFLVRELKKTNPFNGPDAPKRFPSAHSLKDIPQWLITEKKKGRLGHGRINELHEEYR